MGKIGRLIKVFQYMSAFDALQVLIGSIQASAPVLMWSALLLLVLMVTVEAFIIGAVSPFISDASNDLTQRKQIYEHWGTATRGMITMFDNTLGNHSPATWRLVEYVSEWWGLFLLLYKYIVGFA